MRQDFQCTTLGNPALAEATLVRAAREVPAYQRFLAGRNLAQPLLAEAPSVNKENYINRHPLVDLLGAGGTTGLHIVRSAASTGKSLYWPQLAETRRESTASTRRLLELLFSIDSRRTLAIMGFNLGGWVGGDYFDWTLKAIAADCPYPFSAYCPGSRMDEILHAIAAFERLVEQIIVCAVPSAIPHLLASARHAGVKLPWAKLALLTTGEPFPESLRLSIQEQAKPHEPPMYSIYGSAETGGLGFECPGTVALRQLLAQNPDLAADLGIDAPVPHFFHAAAGDAYLEIEDGHLVITKWQAIPLPRYALYDRVAFYNWKALKGAVLAGVARQQTAVYQRLEQSFDSLPDLIAVTGRADKCLLFCGANIMEYMIDAAVRSAKLSAYLTGTYQARLTEAEQGNRLALELELHQGVSLTDELDGLIFRELLTALRCLEPYFAESWRNLYSKWDDLPERRILSLRYHSWPELSESAVSGIKHHSIGGPADGN